MLPGEFVWSDESGLGSSSLIVNRIEVGQGGVFEDSWSNPATRTFESQTGGFVDIDVLAGGEAIFEAYNTYIGDLTNSGVLSLGADQAGNYIATDSFVQSADGSLIAYLSAVNIDGIQVYGPATLAGELEMRLWLGSAPTGGTGDILTYTSLSGAFNLVTGLSDLGNGMWFALDYGLTALTGTVQLIGDMDGDGFVGITDLNAVLGNWNLDVPAGQASSGDPSGDGFVGIEDLNFVLGNWNAGTPQGLAGGIVLGGTSTNSRAIPEPGMIGMFGVGLGILLGRRRKGRASLGPCRRAEARLAGGGLCGSAYHVDGRSLAMCGTRRIAAAVLGAAVFGASAAEASISFDLTPVDNSAVLTGYATYDLDVTTDSDWTAAAGLLELSAGSIYQHEYGVVSGPPNGFILWLYPEVAFDTYVIGNTAGGAGDVGGDGYAFGTGELDVSWYNLTPGEVGTTTIGRLTVTDDATGNLTLMLTTESNEVARFTVGIDAGVAQVSMLIDDGSSSRVSLETDFASRYEARDLPAGFIYPGMPSTRPYTSTDLNYLYFTDGPRPPITSRHGTVSLVVEGSESTTPEPGSLALVGACLVLAALKRR